jgi:hypothetical protein
MAGTFHVKNFMLPIDAQARDKLRAWFKSIPSNDDITKLICTEKNINNCFEKLLKEKGEVR